MSFTDFFERELLDHAFGGNTGGNVYTPPATLYIGLSTSAINEDGSGITEPSGNAYARVAVANTSANWAAAAGSPSAKTNAVAINFPQASGSWGTITHLFISDAASGGNVLVKSAVGTSKTIASGDTASFAIGDISITLD